MGRSEATTGSTPAAPATGLQEEKERLFP
jgi:hypothetical protein